MKSTIKNELYPLVSFLLGVAMAFWFGNLIISTVYAQVPEEATTVDVHIYKKSTVILMATR